MARWSLLLLSRRNNHALFPVRHVTLSLGSYRFLVLRFVHLVRFPQRRQKGRWERFVAYIYRASIPFIDQQCQFDANKNNADCFFVTLMFCTFIKPNAILNCASMWEKNWKSAFKRNECKNFTFMHIFGTPTLWKSKINMYFYLAFLQLPWSLKNVLLFTHFFLCFAGTRKKCKTALDRKPNICSCDTPTFLCEHVTILSYRTFFQGTYSHHAHRILLQQLPHFFLSYLPKKQRIKMVGSCSRSS